LFKAGLSLPDNSDLKNRVLFFFDELAQLNKMDSFVQLLTLARSKNIGIISAIQDFGLIRSKYQKDLLETILNNFNGLILGRMNETSVLKWIEYRLGKEEYIKHEESHSFGPTDFADKITSNRTRHEKNVVLGSEISTLENLEYFLVINSLITKGKRIYQKFKPIAEPFEMYSDEDLVAEWDLSE
jgi:type IV secretory pathway TraG/TraD family ATPase VirD4